MTKIFLIAHWKEGFYSATRKEFGGILFATRYESRDAAEKTIFVLNFKGPVFVQEGYE